MLEGEAEPLRRIAARVDLMIIDGPPLLTSAHAVELAGHVDSVVLVVPPSVSPADLDDVQQRLELLDAKLLGLVTNDGSNVSSRPLEVLEMGAPGSVSSGELTTGTGTHTNGSEEIEDDVASSPAGAPPQHAARTTLGFALRTARREE
jgi:Mrp family chromosome partitioning ATPase